MGREARAHRPSSAPGGTVAVLSSELSRYAAFHQCFAALETPPATQVLWQTSGVGTIARARNKIVQQFTGDWVWMIDDDHVFAPDVLHRLIQRLDDDRVDAVVPLCLKRTPPFRPVLFRWNEEGKARHLATREMVAERGLIEIGAGPGAGLLVRRRVFDRMAPPWFAVGQDVSDLLGEDTFFYRRMRDAHCRVFADLDVQIGHVTSVAIWPGHPNSGARLQWLHVGSKQSAAAAEMERLSVSSGAPVELVET